MYQYGCGSANKAVPKRNPGKWNQGLKPAVSWWLNFDPCRLLACNTKKTHVPWFPSPANLRCTYTLRDTSLAPFCLGMSGAVQLSTATSGNFSRPCSSTPPHLGPERPELANKKACVVGVGVGGWLPPNLGLGIAENPVQDIAPGKYVQTNLQAKFS